MSATDEQVAKTAQRAYCPECGEEFPGDAEHCPHDGTPLYRYNGPNDEDRLLGESLDGRFELHKVLGEGGMGKVYAGKQLSVGRDVAIKVLRQELSNDQQIVKRFFREGRVISGLSHHNIVNLVDFGQDPDSGVLFLAMEMLDGRDMSELLEGQRMKPALALECIRQACAGLSQAHAQSVIHRDLKPENLFIVAGSDGSVQVKILDFGIARALQTNTRLTKTGMVFGTPQYMPPEQSSGGDIGPHTDIYALGIILFEALTGRLPFDGDTPAQIMVAHIQLEPPSLRQYLSPGELPEEVVQLVDSMLCKEPSQRPGDVLEVRDAIEAIQREHGMLPVRVETTGEFDDRFTPWVEPAKTQRDHATSGQLQVDTGMARQQHQTGPPSDDSALAMANTAAFDTNDSPTADVSPAPATTETVHTGSNRTLVAVAVAVLVLVLGAAGAAAFLYSSGSDEKAPDQTAKVEKQTGSPVDEAAEGGASAAAEGAEGDPELVSSIEQATSTMSDAISGAAVAAENANEERQGADTESARERAPSKPARPAAKPEPRRKPAAKPAPPPEPKPEPKKASEPEPEPEQESKDDSLNLFPVE